MAKLIGTAGHVDHGKTTLIRALTGIDADRLPEEKKRGLTIDIGFAYIDLPGHGRVSIVDVPGHEKFVTNMLVGAMGVDVVALCVAADQGVMPQTIEHFQVLRLLPTSQMVVVLTRRDLADDDTAELVKIQVAELLEGTKFQGSPVIEVSAFTGAGLDRLKEALSASLDAESAAKEGPWYLPVDRVFTQPGYGTVVTGTLARGTVKAGEACEVLPGGSKTKIRGLQVHGESVASAVAGQRVAVNVSGIDRAEVERGHVVGQPGTCFVTKVFDTSVEWVSVPKHSARVRVSLGADEVIAKVFLSDEEPDLAQVRCERPVVVAQGQCLVIRQYSPPHVLGGGKVLVPEATVRKKAAGLGLAQGGSLVSLVASRPHGIETAEIGRLLGLGQSELAARLDEAKASGQVYSFAGLWMTPETYSAAKHQFLIALATVHEANPSVALPQRDLVVKNMGAKWAGKPLDRIVSKMAEESDIVAHGTTVRLPTHRPVLPERQRALLDRLLDLLIQAGMNTPNPVEFGILLNVPPQAAQEIVRIGIEAGELVRLDDAVLYPSTFLQALPDRLVATFGTKRFTAGDFRGAFDTTRKYAIPILEHFDSINVTMRQGDERVIVSRTAPQPH